MPGVHCIVPARMGSTRFPGKPLVKLCGKEMILRTLERAKKANCFDKVVCATDSEKILQVVENAGFSVVMTGEAATGSDRVLEAAQKLNSDFIVNLQGDEPLAEIHLLQEITKELLKFPEAWVTAASKLSCKDFHNNTIVKVLYLNNKAIDFTRDISENSFLNNKTWGAHRGIYAYSMESLSEFGKTKRTFREISESLEQLRIIDKREIRIVETPFASASVDVLSDVPVLERMISEEELLKEKI